jgi:hypothetical protein
VGVAVFFIANILEEKAKGRTSVTDVTNEKKKG